MTKQTPIDAPNEPTVEHQEPSPFDLLQKKHFRLTRLVFDLKSDIRSHRDELEQHVEVINAHSDQLASLQSKERLDSQRFERLLNDDKLLRVTTNERDGGYTFWMK